MVRITHPRIGTAAVIVAIVAVVAVVGLFEKTSIERKADRTPAPTARPVADRMPADDMRRVITTESGSLRTALDLIYAEVDYRPLWSGSRSASRRINDLKDGLTDLSRQGVQISAVEAARTAVLAAADNENVRMKTDLLLTKQVLRLAQGVGAGFADLADWHIPADEKDVVGEVAAALDDGRVRKLFRSLAPTHAQYQGLIEALDHYNAIREKGGWRAIDAGSAAQLRQRLAAEGYLSSPANMRERDLTDAVKTFQERNGLKADGVAGAATAKALNVTIDERIGQILANLERWRHMPRDLGEKHIAVNVADQSLAVMEDGDATWTTRTIVGDRTNQTPVLKADITGVTLNPNWEIPPSIASEELLPRLKEDPHYLVDRNIVMADEKTGAQWALVGWDDETAETLPGRLRQLPGAGNSLGMLKIQMDNRFNIYLHDTPNRELFAQDDRYLSHGCVRVENASELAARLLGRDMQEIDEEIAVGETKTLKVNPPLPVYVMYWTAFVDKHGAVHFREDGYGRDQPIVAALGFISMPEPAQVVSRDGKSPP